MRMVFSRVPGIAGCNWLWARTQEHADRGLGFHPSGLMWPHVVCVFHFITCESFYIIAIFPPPSHITATQHSSHRRDIHYLSISPATWTARLIPAHFVLANGKIARVSVTGWNPLGMRTWITKTCRSALDKKHLKFVTPWGASVTKA